MDAVEKEQALAVLQAGGWSEEQINYKAASGEVIEITSDMLSSLIDAYRIVDGRMDLCTNAYYARNENDRYSVIDNTGGKCLSEVFSTKEVAIGWCRGDFQTSDLVDCNSVYIYVDDYDTLSKVDDPLERTFELQLATPEYLWYCDLAEGDENGSTVMFSKSITGKLSLESDNVHATNALLDELEKVWKGVIDTSYISEDACEAMEEMAEQEGWGKTSVETLVANADKAIVDKEPQEQPGKDREEQER